MYYIFSVTNARIIISFIFFYQSVVLFLSTEITISGTQFVSRGDNVTLFCNASKAGNPRRVLLWLKGSQEVIQDGDRITVNVDSENR